MKIVLLARYLPQHGSITHCYALAKGLIDRGHDVHIISGGPSKNKSAVNIFNEAIAYGIKHHKVGFPLKSTHNLPGKIKQLFQYLFATPKALVLLFNLQPDVIHVHYPVTSYLAKIYGTMKRKKFVITYHISGIPRHPLHKKADYAIAISNDLKNELLSRFGYKNEQIRLIFNGVQTKKFCINVNSERKLKIKEELKLPANKIIIGFLGSFTHRKGIDILLNAVQGLEKDSYHLALVGEGDNDWVTSLVQEFRLEGNITLYPYQDPVKFYEVFDIFVLPSRREGFPLVSIEAMMMGIPTIRSDVEGARDQIDHGITGYLFESEKEQDLHSCISLLLNNEQLRDDIGKNSKKKVMNEFSEDTMITKLLEVYKKT